MLLSVLIVLALVLAFYVGYRRGTVYQLFFTAGYALSFVAALAFYKNLGEKLQLFVPYPSVTSDSKMVYYQIPKSFDLDEAFYAGVAFMMILVAGWVLTHFLALFVRELLYVVALKGFDGIVGGVQSLIVCYIVIFLLLKLISFVPMQGLQDSLRASGLSRLIIEHSLFLSQRFDHLWVTRIIG